MGLTPQLATPQAGNGRPSLTPRQKDCLVAIKKLLRRNVGPSLADICDALNVSSIASAHKLVLQLERKGYIYRRPGERRNIEVLP